MAANGSHLRQVAGTTAFPPGESWLGNTATFDISPDGTSLLYSICEFGSFDLARVNLDGSQVTRLTDSPQFEGIPAWSPDGTRIAFLAARPLRIGRPHYMLVRTMTREGAVDRDHHGLYGDPSSAVFHAPRWSPDGKRLAFVTYSGTKWNDSYGFGSYTLRTVAADGTDPMRLTTTVSGPSWSPDGSRIAFAKPDGEGIALFTVAADGSDLRRVTPIEDWIDWRVSPGRARESNLARSWVPAVAWSSTGEHILFVDGSYVKVVSPDGAESKTLPIRFSGGPVPAWSPDGSRIAITAPLDDRSGFVVTMAPDGSDVAPLVRAGPSGSLVAVQAAHYRADRVAAACGEGFVVENSSANPGLVRDCETLAGLRDALFGRGLVNWAAHVAIREWAGVVVVGTPPRVMGLKLSDQGADGVLPTVLGALTELKLLDLSANQLQGPIPPELGQLTNLNTLYLGGNRFTGCIPPALQRVPRNDLPSLGLPDCGAAP